MAIKSFVVILPLDMDITRLLFYHFRFIAHILEKACQFEESNLSRPYLKLESNFNIQASRTTGVVADVATVKADVNENSVVLHEEKDGRINVE